MVWCLGGEEWFIISGKLEDEEGSYGPRVWIRHDYGTAGQIRKLKTHESGTKFWVKTGHIAPLLPEGPHEIDTDYA